MPTSEKHIAANRANAAKSTGPTSETGLRNSSRNSTRHLNLANTILIDNESRERFATLLNSLNADFQPENNTQRALVEKMAVCHWRLLRIWAIETAGIKHETSRQSDSIVGEGAQSRATLALRSIGKNERRPGLGYYRALTAVARLQQARRSGGRENK